MSVVAQAGAWTASVAIIPQVVATTETVALAASRNPAGEKAGGVAVNETPAAISDHAANPAATPIA